jgi:CubicO group peptidase (beta-lactamase class C family)
MNNKMIKKTILLLFFVVGICHEATCSNPVDTYLEQLYRSHIIPGFSVVIVRNDKIAFLNGYGKEYLGESRTMTALTSTAVGSVAKSFTALAAMQLAEQGRLNLDEKVIKYLPWFRTANKELSDRITVRMLLANTSGLQAPAIRNRDDSGNAAESLVRAMESVYLTSEPGTHYEYSNDGFALAGLIISKVAGMSYAKYLDQFVFKPLEMARTTNNPDEFSRLQVLYGHYPGIDSGIPVHEEDSRLNEYVAAGSLLRSSARDMGNYLMALLNGGNFKGKQIVSPGSIKEMWKSCSSFPGISKEDGGEDLPLNYGLGWFSGELDGKQTIFHGGNRRNMSSMIALLPDQKTGIAFLANIDLTLIDKYRYPNLINIVNNIIRVFLNEPVSDFAVPIVPDPTVNSYELPHAEEGKYTGEYIMTEGKDWVYMGSRLVIQEGKDGLYGEIKKGNRTIEKFRIDYITQKTAVSRNLAMPRKLIFNFSGSGKVINVIIDDRRYSRLTEGYYSHFHRETSPGNNLSFLWSNNWQISWYGPDFKGLASENGNRQIIGKKMGNKPEWDDHFSKQFPGNRIIHTGLQLSETLGDNLWHETAVLSSDGNHYYHHYICTTSKGQNGYLIMLTSADIPAPDLISVIPTLLSTFEWMDSSSCTFTGIGSCPTCRTRPTSCLIYKTKSSFTI